MAIYFCDLALDFTDATGDPAGDGSGDVYTGPGGLQAAIEGWGNATAMAAGDTLYLKGTADLSKLVKVTVDVDKTGTWVISDVVQNHNDGGGASGDDWVGELVFIDATTVWVQINDASSDYASVDTADGIDNTTQTETIAGANMTAKACPGIQIDNNTGDTTTGGIWFIACDASWVARAAQAVLEANSKATNCLKITVAARNFFHWEYVTFQNATGDNVNASNLGCDYWVWRHCKFDSAGADGVNALYFDYHRFIQCLFDNNSSDGIYFPVTSCLFSLCRFTGNGGWGVNDTNVGNVFDMCLIRDNTLGNLDMMSHGNAVLHSVIEGTGGGSDGVSIGTDKRAQTVLTSRICNNAAFGIDQATANAQENVEDWNVFYGNVSGDLNNTLSGHNSHGDGANHIGDPADDGLDANYNVEDGKAIDSLEVVLNW